MAPKNTKVDHSKDIAANTASSQESVLKKIYDLYERPTKVQNCGTRSIVEMAHDVSLKKLAPRNKATVMILGNHSSGKSSFINWYLNESILPTGAAVETRGFTLVSASSKIVPPLKGEATLRYFPQLKGITRFGKGLIENLCTIVSDSQSRCFPNVDFIDTPGLVDGSVEYPFDVNDVLLFLADYVDLIFVFLDPHEQALGSRTMEVVKMLNKNHYDKICYYLTKIDTLSSLSDLMKVSNQTTQNLALRVKNTHGWELPTIFLPQEDEDVDSLFHDVNMINKPCERIDLVVKQKIQDNLSIVEKDCNELLVATERIISKSVEKKRKLHLLNLYLLVLVLCFVFGLVLLALYFFMNTWKDYGIELKSQQTKRAVLSLQSFCEKWIPFTSYRSFFTFLFYYMIIHVLGCFLLNLLRKCYYGVSKEELGLLQSNTKSLKSMLEYKEGLYSQYITL